MHLIRKAHLSALIFAALALCFTLAVASVQAFQPDVLTWSAEYDAALRGIAALDPDEQVRGADDLAVKFVRPEFWHYRNLSPDFELSKKWIKLIRSTTYYLVNARTKHTDATLEKMAAKELRQVVVLGAGLDTRAYRYADKMPQVRFFETGPPAAMAYKEKTARKVLDKVPASLTYVAMDLNARTIPAPLKQAGYREDLVTLFIWEGATMYINESAVAATLTFVAQHSAPASAIIFDYIPADIPQGRFAKYGRAQFAALAYAARDEPWVFGFKEGRANQFVQKQGLVVQADMSAEDMAKNYLVRSDGKLDGTPAPYFRLMHAVVPD